MKVNFSACLAFTLKHEGGWSDLDGDSGGATNKGITFATFKRWYPEATLDLLRTISDEQVAHIYAEGYWKPVNADLLSFGVDLMVFDFAVNAGPARSLGIYNKVHAAISTDDSGGSVLDAGLINDLGAAQEAFYRMLNRPKFINGWIHRLQDKTLKAVEMLMAHYTDKVV